MISAPYYEGALVRCSSAPGFKNFADVATDPTTVRFRFVKPDGTVTTWVFGTDVQVVRDSAGLFHADVPADQPGKWFYRWEGTGAVVAAFEHEFRVIASVYP
jgi:hypothetical protein